MALDPDEIARAAERIAPWARRTPLERADLLGADLAWKAEHLQKTGSFKFRGALNRLLALDATQRERGVTTASTGNHGIGLATAARLLEVPAEVFVARNTDAAIIARLERLGAVVRSVDSDDCADAERSARSQGAAQGQVFVSPYNDPLVAAGQGTIALEMLEQLGDVGWDGVDIVVVAVGGGGLIAGIASWIAHAAPAVRVIGAQPMNDAAMFASIEAGRIVDADAAPTLSHSTAGGIEEDAITFPLCRDLVESWIRVRETHIAGAVREFIVTQSQLIEGAAGVAFAAAAELAAIEPQARIAVVSCGARLTPTELRQVMAD